MGDNAPVYRVYLSENNEDEYNITDFNPNGRDSLRTEMIEI